MSLRPLPRPVVAILVFALIGGSTLAACSSGGDSGSEGSGAAPPDVTDPVPPEVTAAADDWPLPGRDYSNSRAAPDSPINSDTVAGLTEVWVGEMPGFGSIGNAATTPLVIGDRVLVQALDSTVRAFERSSGEELWATEVEGGTNIGPNGVAVGWDRVYAPKGTREIFALDLGTGEELWATEIVDTETTGIDIQPQVVDGLVLVSTVPVSLADQFAGGDRGVLTALDAETGEVMWTFDTVEGEDLWGNPEVNSGGGAWFTPAVDPEAGVVYWGIGNPAPFAGTEEFPNGSSRPGDNLYTESVVALDVATGDLLWFHQVFPHDLFDRDHTHTMIVETAEGRALVSAGKGGVILGHDMATGEEMWRTQVGIHRNDELTELESPTEIWPGTYGGIISPPAHADGVVYAATLNAPTTLSPDEPSYIGSELGTDPGELVAVDAATGELLWSSEVDGDPLGGATVVGDLVFTATFQGFIHAYSRDTGDLVWTHEAPGGINGWPAVTDDMLIWPVGLSDPPGLLALALAG